MAKVDKVDKVDKIDEGGGKVETTAPILDSSNKLLTSIESHLDFIRGNTESSEDRRERMRSGGGAAAAGGEVEVSEEDEDGFSMMLLKFLGKVGVAIAGLAVGLAAGVGGYLMSWVKLIGKPIMKFIDNIKPPQWLDDIIKAMKDVGGGVFTKIKNLCLRGWSNGLRNGFSSQHGFWWWYFR